jgi:hypothetical protein
MRQTVSKEPEKVIKKVSQYPHSGDIISRQKVVEAVNALYYLSDREEQLVWTKGRILSTNET